MIGISTGGSRADLVDSRGYTVRVMFRQEKWLIALWKDKGIECREAARLYARSGIALLRSILFPGRELRKLDGRLIDRHPTREDLVMNRACKWFSLLERIGLRPSCLVRSLTLARVLREEGHDAHLVFGVRGDNGQMEGHCWVAVDGNPVNEPPSSFEELGNE
ncbi:MAG: lasso peptide biosynthesis B2 protein [Actinomycetota bacterium]|nr:lasso peptide biosynthesis B2 protein [Actinomycetota bacterium]